MPLEVGCHAVPHFKALTHNIEHACGHEHSTIFKWH